MENQLLKGTPVQRLNTKLFIARPSSTMLYPEVYLLLYNHFPAIVASNAVRVMMRDFMYDRAFVVGPMSKAIRRVHPGSPPSRRTEQARVHGIWPCASSREHGAQAVIASSFHAIAGTV